MNEHDGGPDLSPAPWRAAIQAALRAAGERPEARYLQLATVRPDGRPANRTVVFRGFDTGGDGLCFTTDARSAKAGELAANPWAEVCWYFALSREQFRLGGRVVLASGATRERLWESLSGPSRAGFLAPPPGSVYAEATGAGPGDLAGPPPVFSGLVLLAHRVEHLDLRTTPHTRFLHERDESDDGGPWSVRRVQP